MSPVIGGLCSGYAGLETAVREVFGGTVAWHADNDPRAVAVLEHRFPGVPNHGDITAVDWDSVEPVDILAAGWPCQDISNAGKRKGITGARSRLWKNVAEAAGRLRPGLIVLENTASVLRRGFDVVLADLAAIGYDARWTCLRAGDPEVGAPHPRDRWFCVAYPAAEDPHGAARLQRWTAAARQAQSGRARPDAGGRGGVPVPGAGGRLTLLPTPKATDGPHGGPNQRDGAGNYYLPGVAVRLDQDWVSVDGKDYGPAIRRWETILGRPAPCPTEPGTRGNRRLSPAFAEWMMGLPEGWVTGVPGLSRNDQIHRLGEGVVPRQAVRALELLLPELKAVAA